VGYRALADLLVAIHLLFIVYVVFGGLFALRRGWAAYVHVPVAAYGLLIEIFGWICPLTPLENRLRLAADRQGYAGGFIEHYIMPLVYPPGLTRDAQYVLGGLVLAANIVIYALVIAVRRRRSR